MQTSKNATKFNNLELLFYVFQCLPFVFYWYFFYLQWVNLSKTPSSLHFSVAYWLFGCLIRRFRRGKDLALCRIWDTIAPLCGKVDEWLKSHAWKACIRASVSRVRIPSFPPVKFCIVQAAWFIHIKAACTFCV